MEQRIITVELQIANLLTCDCSIIFYIIIFFKWKFKRSSSFFHETFHQKKNFFRHFSCFFKSHSVDRNEWRL